VGVVLLWLSSGISPISTQLCGAGVGMPLRASHGRHLGPAKCAGCRSQPPPRTVRPGPTEATHAARGSLDLKIDPKSEHCSYHATVNLSRRCLKVIDTFR